MIWLKTSHKKLGNVKTSKSSQMFCFVYLKSNTWTHLFMIIREKHSHLWNWNQNILTIYLQNCLNDQQSSFLSIILQINRSVVAALKLQLMQDKVSHQLLLGLHVHWEEPDLWTLSGAINHNFNTNSSVRDGDREERRRGWLTRKRRRGRRSRWWGTGSGRRLLSAGPSSPGRRSRKCFSPGASPIFAPFGWSSPPTWCPSSLGYNVRCDRGFRQWAAGAEEALALLYSYRYWSSVSVGLSPTVAMQMIQ